MKQANIAALLSISIKIDIRFKATTASIRHGWVPQSFGLADSISHPSNFIKEPGLGSVTLSQTLNEITFIQLGGDDEVSILGSLVARCLVHYFSNRIDTPSILPGYL